jgi:hypothetical protein
MNKEVARRLNKLYGGQPIKADVFGRRIATPAEISRQINPDPDFKTSIDQYLPDKADIDAKNDKRGTR